MTKPTKLPWGKSPFDDMPHDELLLWARRMYAACTSARGALRILRAGDPTSPFWLRRGTGGDAVTEADAVVEEIERRFDSESIYRSFYRYAVDLLFPSPARVGFGWHICLEPGCDIMIARDFVEQPTPPHCPNPKHKDASMRPITWDDLKPGRP